jgi:hypothetical protein
MLPGTELPCSLYLSAIGFADTLGFKLRVGEIGERDPIPDIPGNRYWAYDDVDTAYIEHPAYDWVELRGVGTRVQLGDNQTATVPLPAGFGPFRYYDRSYDSVSICSNGWLAPGAVTGTWWENRILPDPALTRLLAVNWDDLLGPFSGGIWHHWDSVGHRFIVEWDSIHYRMPLDSFETFQAVIYDTTRAAADGTSEFTFQYRTANCLNRSTIGIQDPTRQIAINVAYDDQWNRAAARVVPGRAIKFTTNPPAVGIAERAGREPPRRRPQMQTVVRGVLLLSGPGNRAMLLDATGRLAMKLEPGVNDVRQLSPGVYFVCPASGLEPSAVRKVVVQR